MSDDNSHTAGECVALYFFGLAVGAFLVGLAWWLS